MYHVKSDDGRRRQNKDRLLWKSKENGKGERREEEKKGKEEEKKGNGDFERKKMRENRTRSDKSLLINESVAWHTEKGPEGRKWKERRRVGDYEERAGNKMKRMGLMRKKK